MSDNNSVRRKTNTKTCGILIDILAALIIAGCIIIDLLVVKDSEVTIEAMSIDSVISLVTMLTPFIIPYANNSIVKKYNLSEKEFEAIRGKQTFTYMNMFIVGIVLFVGDAFFATFVLPISMIGALAVCIIYICIFIVPTIYEYAKHKDFVLEYAQMQCSVYAKKREKDLKGDTTAERAIMLILLDNGLNETIDLLLANSKKKKKPNMVSKTDLLVFLVTEQKIFIENAIKNANKEDILTNKIIRQIMQNLDYVSLHSSSFLERNKDADEKSKIYCLFHETCRTIVLVPGEIRDYILFDEFKSSIKSMIYRSAHCEHEQNDDGSETPKYSVFLNFLFSELLNSKNEWFLDVLSELEPQKYLGTYANFTNYLLLISLYLISCVSNDGIVNERSGFNNHIKELLKDKFKHILSNAISKCGSSSSFTKIYNAYMSCNGVLNDMLVKLDGLLGISEVRGFISCFNTAVPQYIPYLLLIAYYHNIEKIDELLIELSEDEIDFIDNSLKYVASRSSLSSTTGIRALIDLLKELNIFSESVTLFELSKLAKFVCDYKERTDNMTQFKQGMSLNQYINDFNEHVKTQPEYNEELDIDESAHKIRVTISEQNYLIKKSVKLDDLILETSPLNYQTLLQCLVRTKCKQDAYNYSEIKGYDEALVEQIININPQYKNAPNFDKYCEEKGISNPLSNCPHCNYILSSRHDDVFVEDGGIQFKIKIDDMLLREITTDEAIMTSSLKHNNNLDAIAITIPTILNHRSHKEENQNMNAQNISKLKDEYLCLSIVYDSSSCVKVDNNKILVFGIIDSYN